MRKITTILLVFGLFACNSSQDKTQSDSKTITIEDRLLYPKTTLSPLFDSLRPAIQTFTIKGDRDTSLVGQNGTTFIILKNTFINSQGQSAMTVSIDLVEVNSIAEIIKTNLQTTSGDKILKTGGMFFVDAKENNKSLTFAEGKSIYVLVKSNYYRDSQMKIFDGKFDDKGKIDWTTARDMGNNIIPIPLSLINFYSCALECSFTQKQKDYLLNPKFENTNIATREFEDRCCVMQVTSCGWLNGLDQKFLDIYTENIDKPLYYSDSLIVDYLAVNFKDQLDTTKKFDWGKEGWITYIYQTFVEFKNQHLTGTVNFDKLGITENTTTEELISKGYSESDADKYIAYFKIKKQIVNSREAVKQTSRLASYSFSINKLGWVNVDRFIDEPNWDASTFIVQTKCKDTLDYISVSLVIPLYNVSVFSIHNENNQYSFTKKDDGYRKLPVGLDAILVAFSYKDNKPYFGKQKINIPKDGQIELTLTASTEQTIKQDINNLTE